jgi:hypothetical protein
MNREAFRTESDTSQSVTRRGFSRRRRRQRTSIGTPPYGRLHHRLHLRHLVGRQGEERLLGEQVSPEALGLPVPASGQLALDVLADEPAEGLEPELHVGPEAGQSARVHPLLLSGPKQGLEVGLDLLPRELVPDPAREVADLEEIEEALQPHPSAALPDGQLERRGIREQQHLRERIDVEVALLLEQALEERPRPRILATERLGGFRPKPLQVEEVEVEDPIERLEIARLLDQGRGKGMPEVVTILEADRVGGLEGVQRFGRRDAHLSASQVADELEDPVVHG